MKIKFLIALMVALLVGNGLAHASSYNLNANADWNESACQGTVNSIDIYKYDVSTGDTVNVHFTNSSSTQLDIQKGFSSIATLNPGQSTDISVVVDNQLVTLSAVPTSTSCSSSSYGGLFLYGHTGTLTCSFYNGDNSRWGVYNTLTGLDSGNAINFFDGNNLIYSLSGSDNESGYIYTGSSSTTPHTFYMRTSTGNLLAQVTCPAKPTAATGGSSPTSGNSTTSKKSSTNSSTTSNNSNQNPQSQQNNSSGSKTPTSVSQASNTGTENIQKSHKTTYLLLSAGLLAILVACGYIFTPKKFQQTIAKKLFKIFH